MMQPRVADQPSLFRARGNNRRRPNGYAILAGLIDALEGRGGGWCAGAILARDLGVTDRAIRAAASASRGRVLGGQRGYCLTTRASLREVDRVVAFLLGQSGAMKRRAMEIQAVRHGKAASS